LTIRVPIAVLASTLVRPKPSRYNVCEHNKPRTLKSDSFRWFSLWDVRGLFFAQSSTNLFGNRHIRHSREGGNDGVLNTTAKSAYKIFVSPSFFCSPILVFHGEFVTIGGSSADVDKPSN